jgi:hypothetical protein
MRRIVLHLPSPALVLASAALLVALTGTSIAAVEASVPNNSVGTSQLKNNAVTAAKIASNAVASAKIASNAVTSAKIASNAVTSAKIAANAITTDKVQDGSLVAADFKSGELPGATAAYARFLNGPLAVPLTLTTLTNLTIPSAGNYVIWAKAYFTSTAAAAITCRLVAGSDFDQSEASPDVGAPQGVALNVVHVYSAAGTADFSCSGSAAGSTANYIKISAMQVGSLTNSG